MKSFTLGYSIQSENDRSNRHVSTSAFGTLSVPPRLLSVNIFT